MRVATSETEAAWNRSFADLVARGLFEVRLVTADPHSGLVEAVTAKLPGVSWQRCRTKRDAITRLILVPDTGTELNSDTMLELSD